MDGTWNIGGLGVAIATPFDRQGGVDYDAFARLMDFIARRRGGAASDFASRESGGADFLVVLGSTGEGATIEPEERRKLVAMAVRAGTGLPIVAGTGSNSTAACCRLTGEAADLGADAVLVVAPYYNKPTPDGLVAHYSAAASAASGKPVVVYNVPGRTGINIGPQILSRLWEIPGIAAIKESSGNLAQIGEMCRTLPAGKVLLSGDDALALPSIALGASGLISVAANILPARVKALVRAGLEGRRDEAIRIQGELLPLMDALFLESNPIPLKAALEMAGLCGGDLRLPLVPASGATRSRLSEALAPFLDGAA